MIIQSKKYEPATMISELKRRFRGRACDATYERAMFGEFEGPG